MSTQATKFVTIVTMLLVLLIKIENGDSISLPKNEVNKISTNMAKEIGVDDDTSLDCSTRPSICGRGEFPPRSVCCQNRCVDVTSDINNCGFCGIRCRFNFQCCNRLCINTNISPFNCGGCGRECSIGRLCLFGMCAFERAVPPLLPPGLQSQNSPQIPNYQSNYPQIPPPIIPMD